VANAATATAAPTAELPSLADVHAWLDGDGDGCVTEAELRAAAEARGIELTEELVQKFLALEADGDCVGLEAFLQSIDGSVEGSGFLFWENCGDGTYFDSSNFRCTNCDPSGC